jgi:poly(beta-D-mannuronate) C5 epimerase
MPTQTLQSPLSRGSLSLLAGALLLASSSAFATAETAKAPIIAKELQQAKTYTVSSAPTEPLALAKPTLPDLSGYTAEAAAAKIVRSKPGKISVRRMMQEDALKDFIGGDNKMAEWVVRQHGIPQAIFIDDGYVNLKELVGKLPKQYISETAPGVYLARLPIVVGRHGILEIDKQTQELRLSQEGGSFLVNDGRCPSRASP